jgi:tripartite-type tricarboxylate transporter receptor subunit TctC
MDFVRDFSKAVALLLALSSVAAPRTVAAQAYPAKPVRIVQGFAAGGNGDTIARLVGQSVGEILGQAFITEARTGAGGNIASEFVAKAPADGYTLILQTGGHAVSAAMYKSLPFEPVSDFRWLSLVSVFPFVIGTSADSRLQNIKDLIDLAKAEPGKLSFSSVGIGTTQHLAGELLQSSAGVRMLHIPYRGGGTPVQDVIAGRVDILFDTVTVARAQVQGGRLRALGVTSRARIPQLPDVPAVAETVPGFEVTSWAALAGPSALLPEIVRTLHGALAKALAQPDLGKRLIDIGGTPTSSTPEETARHVASEVEKWKRVVAQANIPRQ